MLSVGSLLFCPWSWLVEGTGSQTSADEMVRVYLMCLGTESFPGRGSHLKRFIEGHRHSFTSCSQRPNCWSTGGWLFIQNSGTFVFVPLNNHQQTGSLPIWDMSIGEYGQYLICAVHSHPLALGTSQRDPYCRSNCPQHHGHTLRRNAY